LKKRTTTILVIKNHDKSWTPKICSARCAVILRSWLNGKSTALPFGVPMIWREQTDHAMNWYFCCTKIFGYSAKNKKQIVYSNMPSATRPVPHPEIVPVPTYLVDFTEDEMETEGATAVLSSSDDEFLPSQEDKSHLINQLELNDLVRDLNLTKTQAEILGSRLQGWKLLEPDMQYISQSPESVYTIFLN
jgi:hypothetical protein